MTFPLFLVPVTIVATLAAVIGVYLKLTARD